MCSLELSIEILRATSTSSEAHPIYAAEKKVSKKSKIGGVVESRRTSEQNLGHKNKRSAPEFLNLLLQCECRLTSTDDCK